MLIRAPVRRCATGGPVPPRAGPASCVRSDWRIVWLISRSWAHIRLIDRARSWTSSCLGPRPSSRKSPSAMRATWCSSRRIRPLIRWAIQLVAAAMSARAPPRGSAAPAPTPNGPRASSPRDRGPAGPPVADVRATDRTARSGPGRRAAASAHRSASRNRSAAGPGSTPAPGRRPSGPGRSRRWASPRGHRRRTRAPESPCIRARTAAVKGKFDLPSDVDDAVQAGRGSAAPSAARPAPPRRS